MSESDSGRDSPYVDYRPKPTYHHPKQIDDDKNTKLHYSAAKNDVDAIVDYLENESSIVDPENYLKWTPLMMACRHGHFESVKVLLSYRANATLRNKMGMNVLQIAIASGNLEMVEYLLEHFLTGGISKRYLENNFSIISLAILFRHQNILEFLIKKQFQLDIQTHVTGISPLMVAQAIENDNAISTLLNNKVDTKLKNYLGHTAVDIATIRQQMKLFNTNEHKILTQKLSAANHENNQNELQNQQLRTMLQLNKPANSPPTLQALFSPQQLPCIFLSPFPNSPFSNSPSLTYMQFSGSQILPHTRTSSNISPFPIPPPPQVTPISPVAPNSQGQIFFPPNFSPTQPPITISTQVYNSLLSQSHSGSSFLNTRLNSSSAMFLSPPVLNFLSPCM